MFLVTELLELGNSKEFLLPRRGGVFSSCSFAKSSYSLFCDDLKICLVQLNHCVICGIFKEIKSVIFSYQKSKERGTQGEIIMGS